MSEQGFCPNCKCAYLSPQHASLCLSRQGASMTTHERDAIYRRGMDIVTFTDNDLKELKELTKATIYWSPKIPALIARMEAAERLEESLVLMLKAYKDMLASEYSAIPTERLEPNYFESLARLEAWRKSKGEGE